MAKCCFSSVILAPISWIGINEQLRSVCKNVETMSIHTDAIWLAKREHGKGEREEERREGEGGGRERERTATG